MPQNRRLDYIWQKPDHRDFKFQPAWKLLEALPPSFSLTPPSVDDQGQEGSCGPNSMDGLIKFTMNAQGMNVVQTSRQFTYWNTRYLMGTVNEDSGVDNRTMLKALAQYGFAPETIWPYSKPLTAKPTQPVFDAAAPNKITSYASVEQNLQTMKATILAGHPFLFGFTCYEQLVSDQAARDGIIAMPSGSNIGGHDIVFLGWDDTIKCPGTNKPGAFRFLNSWGEGWGQKGLGWFPYEYAINANEAGDFWVVNAVPGATPVPPPPPTPDQTVLFNFTLPYDLNKGSTLTLNKVPAIPAGKYSVVPKVKK